jgi:hypothetical protein
MALPNSKNILDYPARYQFQSGAPCGGSSCCTDTCIQQIVEFYKGKTYSLAYIRRVAQARTSFDERACTGINYVEVLNALRAFGVTHYRLGWGVNSIFVAAKSNVGPTIVGVYYGNYPKNTSGRCGSTNKAEYSGKTDCSFNGAHAVLAIGTRAHKSSTGKYLHTDFLVRDPDHHSSSRPEHPPFDRITATQLNATMQALPRYTGFSKTYCIYPTVRK